MLEKLIQHLEEFARGDEEDIHHLAFTTQMARELLEELKELDLSGH